MTKNFIKAKVNIEGCIIDMIINTNHIVHIGYGIITVSTPFPNGSRTIGLVNVEEFEETLKDMGLLE